MKEIISCFSFSTILLFSISLPTTLTSCEKEVVHDTITVNSLVLQPCDNRNEVMIYSHVPTERNPDFQENPAAYWTNGGLPYETSTLIKFDLSTIPTNVNVASAYLSLYAVPNPLNGDLAHAHSGSDNAVLIQRITTDWSPSTVSWNNKPSTTSSNQIELPQTSDAFKNYPNLDVTNLVKDMLSNGNYGIMLRLKNVNTLYNIQNFASSKHVNADIRPKLVLNYSKH